MPQFCTKCGTQIIDDTSLFCNKCGSQLSTSQQGVARQVIIQSIKKKSYDIEESTQKAHGPDPCTFRAVIFILVSLPLFLLYLSNPQTNSFDMVLGLLFLGVGLYIFTNRQHPWVCVTSLDLFSILIGVVFLFLPIVYPANNQGINTVIIIMGLLFLGGGVYSFVKNRGGF